MYCAFNPDSNPTDANFSFTDIHTHSPSVDICFADANPITQDTP